MRLLLRWFRQQRTGLIPAFALGLLTLIAWYFMTPTWLTVAITTQETEETVVLAAYARGLDKQRRNLIRPLARCNQASGRSRGRLDGCPTAMQIRRDRIWHADFLQ
jgi:hypothetical protein